MEADKIYAIYAGEVHDTIKLLNQYHLELLGIINERGTNWLLVKTVPSQIRYIKEHGPRPMITVIGDPQ